MSFKDRSASSNLLRASWAADRGQSGGGGERCHCPIRERGKGPPPTHASPSSPAALHERDQAQDGPGPGGLTSPGQTPPCCPGSRLPRVEPGLPGPSQLLAGRHKQAAAREEAGGPLGHVGAALASPDPARAPPGLQGASPHPSRRAGGMVMGGRSGRAPPPSHPRQALTVNESLSLLVIGGCPVLVGAGSELRGHQGGRGLLGEGWASEQPGLPQHPCSPHLGLLPHTWESSASASSSSSSVSSSSWSWSWSSSSVGGACAGGCSSLGSVGSGAEGEGGSVGSTWRGGQGGRCCGLGGPTPSPRGPGPGSHHHPGGASGSLPHPRGLKRGDGQLGTGRPLWRVPGSPSWPGWPRARTGGSSFVRRCGAGRGAGPDPLLSPTDLRPVLVPDSSPNAVEEGSSFHLRVSPEKRLCACVRGGIKIKASTSPLPRGPGHLRRGA